MYNYQFELSATRAMNAQTRYRQLFMEQPIYNIKQVVPPFRDRNTLKEIQPQLVYLAYKINVDSRTRQIKKESKTALSLDTQLT